MAKAIGRAIQPTFASTIAPRETSNLASSTRPLEATQWRGVIELSPRPPTSRFGFESFVNLARSSLRFSGLGFDAASMMNSARVCLGIIGLTVLFGGGHCNAHSKRRLKFFTALRQAESFSASFHESASSESFPTLPTARVASCTVASFGENPTRRIHSRAVDGTSFGGSY